MVTDYTEQSNIRNKSNNARRYVRPKDTVFTAKSTVNLRLPFKPQSSRCFLAGAVRFFLGGIRNSGFSSMVEKAENHFNLITFDLRNISC